MYLDDGERGLAGRNMRIEMSKKSRLKNFYSQRGRENEKKGDMG